MKHSLALTGLIALLLASSCEKHDKLLKERSQIEAEINQGNNELRALDAKFATLGQDPMSASAAMDRQVSDYQRGNALLELELADMTKKCTEGEETLKRLRPRLDSYKAKFVH